MSKFLLVTAMFLLPLAGGVLLGLVQHLAYAVMLRHGKIAAERVPPFLILFARGLIAVVVLAIALAIATRAVA